MIRYTASQLLALAPQPFEPTIDHERLVPAFDLGLFAACAGRQAFKRALEHPVTVQLPTRSATHADSHLQRSQADIDRAISRAAMLIAAPRSNPAAPLPGPCRNSPADPTAVPTTSTDIPLPDCSLQDKLASTTDTSLVNNLEVVLAPTNQHAITDTRSTFGHRTAASSLSSSFTPFAPTQRPLWQQINPRRDFNLHTERDELSGVTVTYQAISSSSVYRNVSFEELRLQDYYVGFLLASTTTQKAELPPLQATAISRTSSQTPATNIATPPNAVDRQSAPNTTASFAGLLVISSIIVVQPNQTNAATNAPYPPTTLDKSPPGTVYDRMITVLVNCGTRSQSFEIYQGLLKYCSDHFHVSIDKFNSGAHSSIVVEDVKPTVFSMFTTWMLQRKFRTSQKKKDIDLSYRTIFDMWIFGQDYNVPMLQNYAINVYINAFAKHWCDPSNAEIRHVYQNTQTDSPLRKVIVDSINLSTGPGHTIFGSGSTMPDLPSEFFFDMVQTVSKRPYKFDSWTKKEFRDIYKCRYHIHFNGHKCRRD